MNTATPLIVSVPHSYPTSKLRNVLKLMGHLAVRVERRAAPSLANTRVRAMESATV